VSDDDTEPDKALTIGARLDAETLKRLLDLANDNGHD
jgi:hypothetical protein